MERLSSLDGVFLAAENDRNPMNIGSVAIFGGSAPSIDEVRTLLAERLARVPRLRQRVRLPVGPVGRPVWIDADRFDLSEHVHSAAPTGGNPAALDAFVAEVLARPLDRARPLWSVWVVDELPDDEWALVALVHHCLVDGIAGSDLLGTLLDDGPAVRPTVNDPWSPDPAPSPGRVARFEILSALRTLGARVRGLLTVLGHPVRTARRTRAITTAARRLWYRQRRLATSLTGPIGTERTWARASVSLATIDEIRRASGATVNDVVVAAVTFGFRDLLVGRGEPVADRSVTAMIPVSLRTADARGRTGNLVANVHAELPVGLDDPSAMLAVVRARIEDLKGSHEVDATGLLLRIGDFVPRVFADRVVREILRRQRSVETVVTDVPGPRTPCYLGPYRMTRGYPVAPIAGRVRTCVAIWSYCGILGIGVTGDRATADDGADLARGIERGVARLLAATRPA